MIRNSRAVRTVFALFFILLSPWTAKAWEYPELRPTNTRFFPIFDHAVHAQALVEAIDSTEPGDHVDMLYFLITADPNIGLPVIGALRRAANRGVHVRVITSRLSNLYQDRQGLDILLLADKNLLTPIEFIKFGGPNNWRHGLSFNDAVHEKLFVIRGPAGVKLAGFGGQNLDANENFLDLSFLVKPIDPRFNNLGIQLWEHFENRRQEVLQLIQPEKPQTPSHTALNAATQARVFLKTQKQHEQMAAVRNFLASNGANTQPVEGELRPQGSVQLLSNDVLVHARMGLFGRFMLGRANMPDDIETRVETILRTEKEIYLASMIASFSPRVMAALKEAISRAKVHLLTNSRQSAESFVPWGLSYLETLVSVIELQKSLVDKENLDVKTMVPDERYSYMHMKALFSPRYFLSGSSNFNIQSASNNTEIAVLVDDPIFAQTMGKLILDQVHSRFQHLDCETALSHFKHEHTLVRQIVNYFLSMLY